MQRLSDERLWYNQLRKGPYELNDKIGYDVNFNKFKNHGIELRFFDWFPEEYLKDVMNLIVLFATHSVSTAEPCSWLSVNYQNIILKCVRLGFRCQLSSDECAVILKDLQLSIAVSSLPVEPITLLQRISDKLYELYRLSDLVQMMSPSMTRPVLVSYNYIAFNKLYYDIYKE
jgi:hypothetical protein